MLIEEVEKRTQIRRGTAATPSAPVVSLARGVLFGVGA